MLRRLRLSYMVYNFFRKSELAYNEKNYRRLGLKKKYYSPVSSRDFAGLAPVPDPEPVTRSSFEKCAIYPELSEADLQSLDAFDTNGYAIIRNYLSADEVSAVNAEIDELLQRKKLRFYNNSKIFAAMHFSRLIKGIGNNKKLIELLTVLLRGKPFLFGSMNFRMGSQLASHSDSIHMTTYPLGGMMGVWLALDDVDEDNGPLHFYPGSHKLPYYLNADYDNEGNAWLIGDKSYQAYEKMLQGKIEELKLKKQLFTARKGDLIMWHANLIHGGEPHLNKQKTRKSMVFHFYKEDAICYHEITQRPAIRGKHITR